jgi:hypothetical protein
MDLFIRYFFMALISAGFTVGIRYAIDKIREL